MFAEKNIQFIAEVNLKAKNLKVYQEKYAPEISIRTSMEDYKKRGLACESAAVCRREYDRMRSILKSDYHFYSITG